jgi:hypothetical protein
MRLTPLTLADFYYQQTKSAGVERLDPAKAAEARGYDAKVAVLASAFYDQFTLDNVTFATDTEKASAAAAMADQCIAKTAHPVEYYDQVLEANGHSREQVDLTKVAAPEHQIPAAIANVFFDQLRLDNVKLSSVEDLRDTSVEMARRYIAQYNEALEAREKVAEHIRAVAYAAAEEVVKTSGIDTTPEEILAYLSLNVGDTKVAEADTPAPLIGGLGLFLAPFNEA